MKKIFLALAVITSVSCSDKPNKDRFSDAALTEKLTNSSGEQIAFGDIINKHAGKPLVIEVWASWCGDCVKSMPAFKKLQSDNPDAAYAFISMDKTEDKWKEGIEKHQLVGDHYWTPDGMKGSFGKSIDLDWIPRYIVIDKSGNVALYRAIETDFEKIDTILKTLK